MGRRNAWPIRAVGKSAKFPLSISPNFSLRHLATMTLNSGTTPINPDYSFTVTATPTALQERAFELLGIKPICVQ